MPFLTEELWQRLAAKTEGRPRSIALAAYPQYDVHLTDLPAEREVSLLQNIITAARNLRAEMKLAPRKQVDGTLYSRGAALEIAERRDNVIARLANVKLELVNGSPPPGAGATATTADFDLALRVPAAEMDARRQRLAKERAQLEKARDSSNRQLANEEFLAKAPPAVIESIRQKMAQYDAQIARLGQNLEQL
jgi:valyl-tRNA synthetase